MIAGSLLRPVGGWLADKLGGYRFLLLLLACASAAFAAMSTLPPLAAGTVVLFLAMAALGMGNGAVFQLVPLRFLHPGWDHDRNCRSGGRARRVLHSLWPGLPERQNRALQYGFCGVFGDLSYCMLRAPCIGAALGEDLAGRASPVCCYLCIWESAGRSHGRRGRRAD